MLTNKILSKILLITKNKIKITNKHDQPNQRIKNRTNQQTRTPTILSKIISNPAQRTKAKNNRLPKIIKIRMKTIKRILKVQDEENAEKQLEK